MRILGISCFYHDSAACLVEDGIVRSAVQEERFTRKKHDSSFPGNAITWCLADAGLSAKDIDHVVFYDKPFLKFERIIDTYLRYAPAGFSQFIESVPVWLNDKLWIESHIRNRFPSGRDVLFCSHHESHAASAFYPSPYADAAVITADGVGEWDSLSIGTGEGNTLRLLSSLKFPHSLGLLYSAFTAYCGFRVNSGEYKLMGLAPYGKPVYADLIRKELVKVRSDGSFSLNMKYFNFCTGLTMTNPRFHRLFGGPPRIPDTAFKQKHMDIARSIQAVTEDIMLAVVNHAHGLTKKDNLCLAGGVALNCVANGRIIREGPFKNVWIQPASGDAGGALGAALSVWYGYLDNPRKADGLNDRQSGSLLGPHYSPADIEACLRRCGAVFTPLEHAAIPETAARLIAGNKILGWFQGRMEFGPRALGSRSILGDPRDPDMQSRMNLKIKYRESFRPFAASVLSTETGRLFEYDGISPYMLVTVAVRKDKRLPVMHPSDGLDAVKDVRSAIPAVTHVDHSCRIQTVDRRSNPLYHDTIAAFDRLTGCPAVINTSFNVRGEPIVCSPQDAYRCFLRTDMDFLLIGDFLLDKKLQTVTEKADWKKMIVPD